MALRFRARAPRADNLARVSPTRHGRYDRSALRVGSDLWTVAPIIGRLGINLRLSRPTHAADDCEVAIRIHRVRFAHTSRHIRRLEYQRDAGGSQAQVWPGMAAQFPTLDEIPRAPGVERTTAIV